VSRLETVRGRITGAGRGLRPRAREVRTTAKDYAGGARETVAPAMERAMEKALDVARGVTQEKVLPALHTAQESARTSAAPALASAKEKWADEVVPRVTASVTAAKEAAQPVREEAMRRGAATLAALKGDLEPPRPKGRRRHRVRKVLLFAGLTGVVVGAFHAWRRSQAAESWVSADSYAPSRLEPDAGSTPAADAAGAAPDEVLADEASAEMTETGEVTSPSAVSKRDVDDAIRTAGARSR